MTFKIELQTFKLFCDALAPTLKDTEVTLNFEDDKLLANGLNSSHSQSSRVSIGKEHFEVYGEPKTIIVDFNKLHRFIQKGGTSAFVEIRNVEGHSMEILLKGEANIERKFSIGQVDSLFTGAVWPKVVHDNVIFDIPQKLFNQIINDAVSLITWGRNYIRFEGTNEFLRISSISESNAEHYEAKISELENYSVREESTISLNAEMIDAIAAIKVSKFHVNFSNDTPLWISFEESGVKAIWVTAPYVERE